MGGRRGLLAGMLLWSFLPSVILRALPHNWLMPEAIAAHIVGEPTLWEAGSRLMQADSPQAWKALIEAADLLRENRKAMEQCKKDAQRTRKPVSCHFHVSPKG